MAYLSNVCCSAFDDPYFANHELIRCCRAMARLRSRLPRFSNDDDDVLRHQTPDSHDWMNEILTVSIYTINRKHREGIKLGMISRCKHPIELDSSPTL